MWNKKCGIRKMGKKMEERNEGKKEKISKQVLTE